MICHAGPALGGPGAVFWKEGHVTAPRLFCSRTGLLVVDVQERLAAAMPADSLAAVVKNMRILIQGARVLGLPVVVSEQYTKGLGPTLSELREVLPEGAPVIEKLHFSCWGSPELASTIKGLGRDQWIVVGIETHVCVFQTVRDMVDHGLVVHVPVDAVLSRTRQNVDAGLRLMERAGAVLSSTEAVLFDMLELAGTPEFKAISKLVK